MRLRDCIGAPAWIGCRKRPVKALLPHFALLALLGSVSVQAASLQAIDVDDRPVVLNSPGAVTAVISSSPDTQNATRDAGAQLDRYRGRPDFRLVIVVDLRDSLAGIVGGYVRDRMKQNLDAEALRLRPFYRANGNPHNPRPDLEAIPDFDGKIVDSLHWDKDPARLRVTVFGRDGHVLRRWDDLKDYRELDAAVTKGLAPQPSPSAPPSAT